MSEENSKEYSKTKKALGIGAVILFLIFMVVVTFAVGYPFISFIKEPEEFRNLLKSFGIFGDIIFIFIVVIQVVIAIIPGEPFEVFAGLAFGIVRGTLLCLIGDLIGTVIVFFLVRKLGVIVFDMFFSREKLNQLKFLKNTEKNKLLLFFIFLLPGTPKDLITFFVGLTDIKLSEWLIISTVARIPSVITSVIGGSTIEKEEYAMAIIVFGVTIAISIAGLAIYNAILKKKNGNPPTHDKEVNNNEKQ